MEINKNNTREKYCLTCGKSFMAERSTKKYCSDVCKQIAFYHRNSPVALPLSDTEAVAANGNPEDQQNDRLAMMANNLQNEEPLTIALNSRQTFCESGAVIMPTAFNTTSSIPLTVNDTIESPNAALQEEKVLRPIQNTLHPIKHPLTVSDNYQPVLSGLIEAIAAAVDADHQRYRMATCPKEYWQGDAFAAVVWMNIRLRCLIENLLWLSQHQQIDRKPFNHIRHAFSAMMLSNCFKRLPVNYPYITLLKELEQQCHTIATQQKKKGPFLLQISVQRKVEFIATRFLLAAAVPKVKFSELNFEN